MAKKYYAVQKGLKPGIYDSWTECQKNINGYSGAIYKGFMTIEEAQAFLEKDTEYRRFEQQSLLKENLIKGATENENNQLFPEVYAFTDGSYNIASKVYGYGGFLIHGTDKYVLQGNGNDEEMASMRNVAGEILGAEAAVIKAIELGLKEVHIYYDYAGVEMWATGGWKTNKTGTMRYAENMKSYARQIKIVFHKVKGHSGIAGNEEADALAKEAVGIN